MKKHAEHWNKDNRKKLYHRLAEQLYNFTGVLTKYLAWFWPFRVEKYCYKITTINVRLDKLWNFYIPYFLKPI